MCAAQSVTRDLKLGDEASVSVVNRFGRVNVAAKAGAGDQKVSGQLTASSPTGVLETEIKVSDNDGQKLIEVTGTTRQKRIDLMLVVPERTTIKAETDAGAVQISGNLSTIQVKTETGTVAVDVPTDDLSYKFLWTESRPRFLADFELPPVHELKAGRFEIQGTYRRDQGERTPEQNGEIQPTPDAPPVQVPRSVSLDLTTARGIILLNVPPNEVGSDLRERPLTEAAKAIVRSGDTLLMDAIRRAAPKYFSDYVNSLPPYKRQPTFAKREDGLGGPPAAVKQALVRVTDLNNRAIAGLKTDDFEVLENGNPRDIVSVTNSTAPFNLVLLLDVSGSVENYVNFIRKAARAFVDTVDARDRVSIIIFNDDVKVLSKFTTDKKKLSMSLDTFDAGGGTAYYDALAYTIADTLRPLRGERSAIVILTDGDDNRSFLPFDSLMGSIEESGALIYPLYVPSGLIAMAAQNVNMDIDPLRKKYMALSAKSEGEGDRLAKVSGGVYYPITRIEQIQQAYEDIVVQLRTAYVVTFRSGSAAAGNGVPTRLKIRVKRENAFTNVNSVTPVIGN